MADQGESAAAKQAAAKMAGLNITEAQAANLQSTEGGEVAATVEELQGKHADVALASAQKVEALKKEEFLAAMMGNQIRAQKAANEANLQGKAHKFWSTQPVLQQQEIAETPEGTKLSKKELNEAKALAEAKRPVGPLDEAKTPADVRQEPYNLPKGFHWCTIDISKEEELKEAYTLLSLNYVEDDDNMFRFDYSPEFLRWALMPPGYFSDWIVGVRADASNKLLAMITGIPVHVHVLDNEKSVKMAEINFLCIHKKLRSKRLAPMLIKEVTRRVNLVDQWQAVYTAGVRIPTPIGVAQYFHRSLNPKKLISVGFSRLQPRMTMARTIKLYSVPKEPKLNLVPLEKRHCASAAKLLSDYLKKFKVWIEMDAAEIEHWLVPREDVVYAYVIESASDKNEVTDMISFYNLPSTIINNPTYNHLKAAYSFYNVATTTTLKELMADGLVFAAQNDFDVFNALDLMENKSFLKDLKFGEGDGRLHYYLYNYGAGPEMPSSEIGIVLL